MPVPLGIGGATPFQMRSNHQTAFNHSFRDTAPFNPVQSRVKCGFCGVWARKGGPCYLCRRFVKGLPAPRDNSVKVAPSESTIFHMSRSSYRDPMASAAVNSTSNTTLAAASADSRFGRSATASGSRGARASSKENSSATAQQVHEKIKCKSCGCWATKGKPCSLCRTVTKSV
jgi:hypothetical protein